MTLPTIIDLATVRALYASGAWTPGRLIAALCGRIEAGDPAAFISRTPPGVLDAQVAALLARAPMPNSLPLWGIPFAVKDNIDVAGLPTTAACPAFAHAVDRDASVVARLRASGAIVMGKANLDQFATGLNGTRSPYGIPRCVFSPDHISGGSSSGSAVAVALGLVSFSLGTDTAGSGRVPAAFNNLVGVKPTPGLLSSAGLVPACRSLDCVSIFALNVADAVAVRAVAEGYDPADCYSRRAAPKSLPRSRLRVGILAEADRQFFGDGESARLYADAIGRLGETTVEIDYAPFRQIAALLYEGPWVAERLAAFEGFDVPVDAMEPTVAKITMNGGEFSAVDTFRGLYAFEALKRRAEAEWAKIDIMLLPSAPTIYTVDEMLADPIRLNSNLGTYTNFFNLLGLSAIAVPAGFRSDGIPMGVTLAAPGFYDDALAPIADRLHRSAASGAGIDRVAALPPLPARDGPDDRIEIVVVGAHLSGMPLNRELTDPGGALVAQTHTAGSYRLFVLPGTVPPKPGLLRDPSATGPGLAIEVWSLDPAAFGQFVARIPAPLGIGKIELKDGSEVSGFLCEPFAVEGAREITGLGGWRAYIASLEPVTG